MKKYLLILFIMLLYILFHDSKMAEASVYGANEQYNQPCNTTYLNSYGPVTIYESSSVKSKKLIPFLILSLTTAISVAAVWKD